MITKGKITDQILRLYTGGNPSDDKEISRDDINVLVGQVVNRLLKTEHISVNMGSGDMFPPHTLVTSYVVPTYGSMEEIHANHDYAFLPVIPISLPRNMGVWEVSDLGCNEQFIPLQSGQFNLLSKQDQLQYLEGQIGYWAENDKIFFSLGGNKFSSKYKEIMIKLLIVDPNVLGEYDYLAIPAEMEEAVIKECLTILGALPKVVDKVSDSNNQI